jgi:predicted nuclease of restriction endonuclease-like (RecB) superfamily
MSERATALATDYKDWLKELKTKVRQVQLKAAVAVNQELLKFYWELGADIVEKQVSAAWGSGFLKQLSQDLTAEFPEMKGFSKRNLEQIRRWYSFWSAHQELAKQPASQIGQQIAARITQIPWWHNVVIVSKCQSLREAEYYVQNTIAHGWSRSVLIHQIESGLWQREGKAITNFTKALSPPQSDLATQTLKDPYVFDFLTLTKEHNERELEAGLIEHITHFLLELGAGFAYIGRQVPLQVGERDFFLDLLFYHTRLHCYIVVELKTVDFEPEHAGKLNFYLKAVDEQLRQEGDRASIGILLCKSRDKTVVEYALSDVHKPIGVSEYQLTRTLPENLKSSLPSIEELEAELAPGEESGSEDIGGEHE